MGCFEKYVCKIYKKVDFYAKIDKKNLYELIRML